MKTIKYITDDEGNTNIEAEGTGYEILCYLVDLNESILKKLEEKFGEDIVKVFRKEIANFLLKDVK